MKKLTSFFMAGVLCFSAAGVPVTANAAVIGNGSIASPCYLYAESISSTLTISGNTATCRSSVIGISGVTKKIIIKQKLQRLDGNDWVDVKTWTKTAEQDSTSFTNTYDLSIRGKYRVWTDASCYSSSAFQTISKESTHKTY